MKKIQQRVTNIGDMRQRVYIHERAIARPAWGSIDFDETFTGTARWAAIKTLGGKRVFDGTGQDEVATHIVYIRFDSSVSSQTFVQVTDGRRFRILQVEDYDERHEFMALLCTDRGFNEAAKS